MANPARYLLFTTQVGRYNGDRFRLLIMPAPSLQRYLLLPRGLRYAGASGYSLLPGMCLPTGLPGVACIVPSRLLRDMRHWQPRQREDHLAGTPGKDEDGAADDMA